MNRPGRQYVPLHVIIPVVLAAFELYLNDFKSIPLWTMMLLVSGAVAVWVIRDARR